MKRHALLVLSISLLVASCGKPTRSSGADTQTVTPPVAGTFTASATLPPTRTSTLMLITGTLTMQVNVRSGPARGTNSLGLLNAGTTVQIVSRTGDGSWYQIFYPAAPQGRAWVAAQYIQVTAGTVIPVQPTSTRSGPTGVLTIQVNVRSGPATTFSSLGMLDQNTNVSLTGKNATGSWFQIEYANAPGGRGWIAAQYVSTEAAAYLPVLDDYGTPVATVSQATSSGPAQTPSPTTGIAPDDRDSAASPALKMIFSSSGTRRFTYSSQLSSPQGDSQDWVEFTPFSTTGTNAWLVFSLTCTGNGTITVEMLQGGAPLSGWGSLQCGDNARLVTLPAGQTYEIQLTAVTGPSLTLASYALTVENKP